MRIHQNLRRLASDKSSITIEPITDQYSTVKSSLQSSRYKGVVPQPNGRWGAQIYEKHQRVWLGTFNLESEAARAYDVAAQRFRGRDAVTNFKPLSESDDSDVTELQFLDLRSKSDIVDMLRKHTYTDELLHNRRKSLCNFKNKRSTDVKHLNNFVSLVKQEHLFEKTVTPSDVGKLNRLVIPKQHAEKHFPLKGGNGILLNFEDGSGKVWRFRYSYWSSSQSYVLTKGWSRFVKEKGLRAGDVVSFHSYCFVDGEEGGNEEKRLFIDCKHRIIQQLPRVVRLFGVDINSNAGDCCINSNAKKMCGTVDSS